MRVALEPGPLGGAVILGSVLLAGSGGRVSWWITGALVTTVAAVVTVAVNERTIVRWIIDWAEYRWRRESRARARTATLEVSDVRVADGVCGVGDAGTILVAMIQLAPNLDLPTVITEESVYTEDTLPVSAVAAMLDQYGLTVDIDIVTTGQRIRSTGSYRMLYDQLIGPHPVVGNRSTWLVIRLDLDRNLAVLARRGPVTAVAPKALAAAAHRIAGRLRQRGVSALVLPATAMVEATRLLHAGVEISELRETWRGLTSTVPGRRVTSYALDWRDFGETTLEECWTWNSGHTTVVVSLTHHADGPRVLVRYIGTDTTAPRYLKPLTGRQSTALLASLPTGESVRSLPQAMWDSADRDAGGLRELTITIGPNGQIFGAISGRPRHTLALPLYDPSHYQPQSRRIDVCAELPVAQQFVLRATVVGAQVEIHTDRPGRWEHLVAAVGDPHCLRLASAVEDERTDRSDAEPQTDTATIAVFDHLPPRVSAAHTIMTVSEPGTDGPRPVDLTIHQVSPTTVDVGIPMRTVRVDLIEPRGETRYLEPVAEQNPGAIPPSVAAVPDPPRSVDHRVSAGE
ncbi:type VII secretion protein EccE [Nocardia sp. NPDC050793]|uniref:type VII secretion protein EccE n=1 Tax=Nocardia sp. NPDC050793 TaxID=3155159 RepID=UPI0033C68C90